MSDSLNIHLISLLKTGIDINTLKVHSSFLLGLKDGWTESLTIGLLYEFFIIHVRLVN